MLVICIHKFEPVDTGGTVTNMENRKVDDFILGNLKHKITFWSQISNMLAICVFKFEPISYSGYRISNISAAATYFSRATNFSWLETHIVCVLE